MFHHAAAEKAFSAPLLAKTLLARISRHLLLTRLGFDAAARLSTIGPDTLRDTRLSANALTGEQVDQEALPFFMQARFGRSIL